VADKSVARSRLLEPNRHATENEDDGMDEGLTYDAQMHFK